MGGHPWVYEGEVTGLSGPVSDGQLVDVISRRGSWLGCGFFQQPLPHPGTGAVPNPNDRFDRAFLAAAHPVRMGLSQDRHGAGG